MAVYAFYSIDNIQPGIANDERMEIIALACLQFISSIYVYTCNLVIVLYVSFLYYIV